DFDDTSRPLTFLRCFQEAREQSHCLKQGAVSMLALRPGQEHPGQGDVLEFAQVAEVVLGGQALFTRPAKGLAQSPLRDPHPCHECRYRTHIGEEVSDIQALCLVEQVESAVQISLGLPYASQSNTPTRPVLREPCALAQLLAFQQALLGDI